MSPQTVTPPPETCSKCGWPLGYASSHFRSRCNPVGGAAADELAAKLEGVARATKSGYGQDTVAIVFDSGSSVVLAVSKEGKFRVEENNVHIVGEHGVEGAVEVCRLFAQICLVP